ncbi:hypothetical protein [Nitrococcus mobilis]|uniref:Transposase n=1 Tax=Nitrococcus mobilis Nb-231 TaxID=314278 RepID=A4BMT7_9GAMM|nr:hypothetical protein [Nitrococcus mobilis]EAR23625.1 hypothetical protein NB231_17433 [Nitrococcus mobilis Nb-231]
MSTSAPRKLPQISDFPPQEVAPAGVLLESCRRQRAEIQALRDEIARLKGGNPKSPIKASKLESAEQDAERHKDKRRGKHKRSKTHRLEIHDLIVLAPVPVPAPPAGSRLKGYDDVTVQDLHIGAHNTRYRLERWVDTIGRVAARPRSPRDRAARQSRRARRRAYCDQLLHASHG